MTKPIYVETNISAPVEEVWRASQEPHLHEQWDVRFSSITYQSKKREDELQHFTYQTNVFPGLTVSGWGKSIGTHNAEDGSRTSSLHFGTDQKISPIKEGRGYWKYTPAEKGTKFLTQYNFRANWGAKWFRPLIGWGTALSFDVFKRWLEKQEAPRSQYLRFFIYWLLTLLFAFIWIYHGFVPKLIALHPSEVELARNPFFPAESVVLMVGLAEVAFGFFYLMRKKRKGLFKLQLIVFPLLTIVVSVTDPTILTHPFSPFTYNLALMALSAIGVFVADDVPTASNCKRSP